ncbi:MAG: aminotransferase-like domain-containing protein [Planctomycetota bacterium]|jgi:2-aminoadipate transaminase
MESIFSDRISDVPRSFIREILKVAADPSVISFAGGLPNRALFPVEELKEAANNVFDSHGREMLQYRNSEGHPGLRRHIARRYEEKHDLTVRLENILITSGSQQGLDLLGRILLNEGDEVVIEEPGYLGAIQVLSGYKAHLNPVPVTEDGMNLRALEAVLSGRKPKLIYAVPNFQNPSGVSYSSETRQGLAELLEGTTTVFVEDGPYGELRFEGVAKPSLKRLLPENTVLLGSFSKIIAPGFRTGWLVAPDHMMDKLLIAKQAADLHTNSFSQYVIHQYLASNDIDSHIGNIVEVYGRQQQSMLDAIREHFPTTVRYTKPEGGMFLWITLPGGASSMDLFDLAIKDQVAFVPGDPFYVNRKEPASTLRLNFSCADEGMIQTGIRRLAKAISALI